MRIANGGWLCPFNEPSAFHVLRRGILTSDFSRGDADVIEVNHSTRSWEMFNREMLLGIHLLHDFLPDRAGRHVAIGRTIGRRGLPIFAFAIPFPDADHELRCIAQEPSVGLTVVGTGFTGRWPANA